MKYCMMILLIAMTITLAWLGYPWLAAFAIFLTGDFMCREAAKI